MLNSRAGWHRAPPPDTSGRGRSWATPGHPRHGLRQRRAHARPGHRSHHTSSPFAGELLTGAMDGIGPPSTWCSCVDSAGDPRRKGGGRRQAARPPRSTGSSTPRCRQAVLPAVCGPRRRCSPTPPARARRPGRIVPDDRAGGATATRNVAGSRAPADRRSRQDRRHRHRRAAGSHRDALATTGVAGVSPRPRAVTSPTAPSRGRSSTARTADRDHLLQRPDLATGVLLAAARLGIRVPDELSVVGYDDQQILARARPPLTTVALPHQAMGETAVRLLLDALAAGTAPEAQHCGCPARAGRAGLGGLPG
ncbi:substrate-binding domain-containing protein [Pseudonocardia sp. MCCB 268]|nr:substrate-binding domain-containing protein [Pseudonocardia cytotoxica]